MHCPLAKEVLTANLLAVAIDLPVNGRPCLVSNTGAQPLYLSPNQTATALNGFLVPAMTTLQTKFTVKNNLSVISNATGTSVAVLILDI